MVISINRKQPFETVYENYYDRLYKYTYMILLNREDTEDIVSETFMAAYAHYDDYDPEKSSIQTWLSRIAHNKALDLINSSAYKNRNPLDDEDTRGASDPALTKMTEINDKADRILSALAIGEREFLNLRYGLELSDKEIGALLNEKENTVSKRYQRLLKKCRDIANRFTSE